MSNMMIVLWCPLAEDLCDIMFILVQWKKKVAGMYALVRLEVSFILQESKLWYY